ncbi:hypothetical protein Tco_1292581 [Tanacetum coccineum]
MALSIADQIALDIIDGSTDSDFKIGKCNLRLSSDVTSKEATLQVVYDVLKLTPFYKAFQVTADAPEIYMQEFWASAYVHNRSVRFKMNNKKHIIGLEQFRDILQICPRVGNKKFVEPPLEKEILIFLASLGHSGDIRKITDVNVNKLHQPWRSVAVYITNVQAVHPSYDSPSGFLKSQILGLVVNLVMEKDLHPRRNKVNWHYARDTQCSQQSMSSQGISYSVVRGYLASGTNQRGHPNSDSYKEYMLGLHEQFLLRQKGSKKSYYMTESLNQNIPLPPRKRSLEKQNKDFRVETISELTDRAEQLKQSQREKRQELIASHASVSVHRRNCVIPGVPECNPDKTSR